MDDFTTSERIEETWAKSWDKSADALMKSAQGWVELGSYAEAAKCQVMSQTYRQVAREMRTPRWLRLEREESSN